MAPTSDFDWVKARTDCSISNVFERLKITVARDAAARTDTLIKGGAHHGFSAVPEGRTVSVVLQGVPEQMSVVFEKKETAIAVRDGEGKQTFEATLTLNDSGECRLKVDGKELDLWQFRKLALESFFFDNPWRKPTAE
jgi:hypothetical protein